MYSKIDITYENNENSEPYGDLIPLMTCKKASNKEYTYEFTKPYSAVITVGGVVGIINKSFAVGDRVKGKMLDNGTVSVRVAEHTKENEKPANPASYQEFLDVPSGNLKLIAE
ncbi:hypothetical protein DF947_00685 [Pedobacter paludis]|uniref:Uncharacterized protein n=1 Tax=Pedobacter paludis TaxID=2203212 RepID=A0A317F565_9SPHI|nr:hypothetical protein DF947_00685 [Pedobacter paludis]